MNEYQNLTMDEFVEIVDKKAKKFPLFGDSNYEQEEIPSYFFKLWDKSKKQAPKNRLNYEVIWDEKLPKRMVFLLFNPSIANSDILDGTLKNCVKIIYSQNQKQTNPVDMYGGMIVYNTFTVRHPQIKDALLLLNKNYEYENNPIFDLKKNVKKGDMLVVAWGNDAKAKLDDEYYKKLKAAVNDFQNAGNVAYCYRCNTSGKKQPSHPSPRCTSIVNNFCNKDTILKSLRNDLMSINEN
ncbi:MAG: DUF1643 domain-containing protein [Candidatus Gastranaerophilales bacterium]|nr:DUF1643 domain-containing protein [Candidatus Gastranaerophilales bacterium]